MLWYMQVPLQGTRAVQWVSSMASTRHAIRLYGVNLISDHSVLDIVQIMGAIAEK
jgi:hypothetical protein